MRNQFQNLVVGLLASLLTVSMFAQPCLSGWQYRKTISVANGGSGLTNHQVSVTINTQALVALGKVRADGGDIRFTDASGNSLSYWYDPTQFNTSSTVFWIKANAPAGGSFIYMFYGNATSPAVASGIGTFEFFDSFETGNISPLTWDKCGNNSNVSVINGNATFQSNGATVPTDYLITSKQSFSTRVIAETKVNSVAQGRSIIGLVDAAGDGYAAAYEGIVMKMMKISSGGQCRAVQQLAFPNQTTAGGMAGIMSVNWPTASIQNIAWANGSTAYADTDKSASFGNDKKVVIGTVYNGTNAGNMQIDYVRVRKYADIQPVLTLGQEDEAPVGATASNTGPYCNGDDIVLSATSYSNAVYEWTGPGGFTCKQRDTVFPSNLVYSGTYSLNITMPGPGGCNATNIQTVVDVSTASVAGSITGATTLCEGYNSGTLTLGGETGDILRWEMSNSAIGPWVTLSNTTNTLAYQNLSDTTYYRSVVQSGACPQAISSATQVNIDKATVGGFTLGTDDVCDGANGGNVNLVYHNGNILKWETSVDGGLSWTDVVSSSTTQSYTDLNETTTYRAQLKSGVCPTKYSSETTITVNPNPVSDFTATQVCAGNNTEFYDASTVASGSIVNYNWNFGNGSGSIAQDPINQYAAFGTYTVSLTSISDKGCGNTVSKNVIVDANPKVDFNFANVCLGFPMSFQSVTSVQGSTITGLFWDLGDGNTSNQVNVNHTYAAANSYDVKLIATSALGCKDSITQTVEVAQPVNVDFLADSVCLGESIQFMNTSSSGSSNVQYTWNFGDGGTSALLSPSYTYAAKGVYTVILQASIPGNNTNCLSSKSQNVEIYERPTANFTFNNECLSDTLSFVNQTIYSGGLSNLTYNWIFNDGNQGSTQDIDHKYNIPGLYNVEMSAETMFGCTSDVTKQVEVYQMPSADFSMTNVCLNNLSEFVNTSFIGLGTMTYEWDFDNGMTSTLESPTLTFAEDGAFQIELIATSNNGCLDTVVKTYTVYPEPLASFTFTEVCDGYPTPFTDNSTINSGSINSYSWDFGDGSSAGSTSPTHQYLNLGNYDVTLRVVSDKNCSDDTTIVAIVNPNPVANFDIQDACIGFAVGFTNNSTIVSGTLTNLWDFGDGASSNLASPSNLYFTPGLFDVKLKVTSGKGCVDSIIKIAEVFSPPVFSLGVDESISLGAEIELQGFYSGAQAYNWSPSEGLDNSSASNPIASPSEETTYVLTITDGNGCIGSDSITIAVIDDFILQVNNLITPDGNGINDKWVIGNIENYGSATVYIYDRWGNEILKTTDYQNDWEGVSGTDQLPDGTYYYIISAPGQEKVYKGGLTVLRNK